MLKYERVIQNVFSGINENIREQFNKETTLERNQSPPLQVNVRDTIRNHKKDGTTDKSMKDILNKNNVVDIKESALQFEEVKEQDYSSSFELLAEGSYIPIDSSNL